MTYKLPTAEDLKKVDLSWKRYLLPSIHPEGRKILFWMLGLVLFFGLIFKVVWMLGLCLCVFTYYFFRNPTRVTPKGDDLIISPADGIVSNIKEMVPPKGLGMGSEKVIRVSIFMSVFSVHVNRSPASGQVTHLEYIPSGKFFSVADKDSEENERQLIGMKLPNGKKIGFVQIAGLIARRIYCPLEVGQKLQAGEIFGMIRFGSRLDVFLPKGVEPTILLGQVAVAGETVLAKMDKKGTK